MNVSEAAMRLGLSTSTIREQVRRGRLAAKGRGARADIDLEKVERYRRDHLGQVGKKRHTDETKAKMRAAKLGRKQTPEHVANAAAARTGKHASAEHRRHVSEALSGKPFTTDHLYKLRAYHRKRRGIPLPAATRARIAEAQIRAYEEGRRPYTPLENRAAEILLPLGFVRNVLLDGHGFDFGSPDGAMLVEVNGCAWHDHRSIKPECPTRMRKASNSRDEERRDIARANGRILVELWECEERDWPLAVSLIA